MTRPAVASVIAGMRTPDQAAKNARAADLELPPEAVDRLTAASDAVKAALDANPDMWQPAATSRYR